MTTTKTLPEDVCLHSLPDGRLALTHSTAGQLGPSLHGVVRLFDDRAYVLLDTQRYAVITYADQMTCELDFEAFQREVAASEISALESRTQATTGFATARLSRRKLQR